MQIITDWVSEIATGLTASALTGGFMFVRRRFGMRAQNKGQRDLLEGIKNPLFVYPPRQPLQNILDPKPILNQLAIQDFLAINNLISAFLAVGLREPGKTCDTNHLREDQKKDHDLVLICSSRSNTVTRDALRELQKTYRNKSPNFVQDKTSPGKEKWHIKLAGGIFQSNSYDVEEQQVRDPSIGTSDPAMVTMRDMAVIVKAPNPWNKHRKILIVAGIRGIGTWGAAECLKKEVWKLLHKKKRVGGAMSKSGDFAAVVEITYENSDIKIDKTDILQFVDLDDVSPQ